jgi:LysR family transcriptional regulator, nitrogen assimilation regulatory protein
VNTRQLQCFLQVAEFRSFTRAAAVLHVAQPALSRSVRALEDDLGVALFHRSERGVTLTEQGELLRARATDLLAEMARVRDEVGAPARELRGELSLGMPPSMQQMVTVPLIQAFRVEHPAVVLRFTEGISATLSEALLLGKIDLAVVSANEPIASLASRLLVSEDMVLVAAREAGLALTQPVSIDRVATLPLIVTPRPNAVRTLIDTALAAHGRALRPVLEANATSVMLQLVAGGVGWTVLPYSAVHAALTAGTVCAAPVQGLRIGWTVAHSRERTLSRAGSEVARLLRVQVSQAIENGRWPSARQEDSSPNS